MKNQQTLVAVDTHTHTCILMTEITKATKALLVYQKILNWGGLFDDLIWLCKLSKIIIV